MDQRLTRSQPRTLSRRQLLQWFALGAGGAMLASQGLAVPAAAAAPARRAAPRLVAQEPRSGGTLRVGLLGDFANLDGYNRSWVNFPFARNVYDTLLRYDHQYQAHPQLAEKWEVAPDFTKVTLTLRSGVKFHNGRSFTSKDVAANLERATDSKKGLHMYNAFITVDRWETPNDQTITIFYKQPDPALLDALEHLPIIAPEAFDQLTPQGGTIGTGPFRFVEWVPGDHATFEKFADYWGQPRPYLDKIIFKPFTDADAMTVALESQSLDLISDTPYKDAARLGRDGYVQSIGEPSALWWVIYINPNKEPFTDKRVRQAMQWALDRETIVKQALYGQGKPTSTFWPEFSIAYDADLAQAYSFNPDKAKALLAEAGLGDGFETSITAFDLTTAAIAQIFQADLAKLGIKASIQLLDLNLFYDTLYGAKYNMILSFGANANKYPSLAMTGSHYRVENNAVLKPDGYWPEAYVEGVKAGRVEPDKEKQKQIWRQVTQAMIDEAWAVPFAWKYAVFTMHPYVKGFDTNIDDMMLLGDVWMEQ